jgi:hypothetical protein
VIPEGFTLLVGAPKIGKSWMALSVALAVASGGVAFGGIPVGDPRPVLLIAPEDSDRRMQDCIRKLWPDGHGSWPPYLDYFTEIEPGQVIATINAWLEELPPNTKPLVILDTVGKILPRELPGESQYQRDYRISGLLKRVCDQRRGTGLIGLPRPKVNRRRLCSHNLQHPRSRRGS